MDRYSQKNNLRPVVHPMPITVAAPSKDPHTSTSVARDSGSASETRESGSDMFHLTRRSGLPNLLAHFSIQNELIEASCSSGDNIR
jgi:hypothetical protein